MKPSILSASLNMRSILLYFFCWGLSPIWNLDMAHPLIASHDASIP